MSNLPLPGELLSTTDKADLEEGELISSPIPSALIPSHGGLAMLQRATSRESREQREVSSGSEMDRSSPPNYLFGGAHNGVPGGHADYYSATQPRQTSEFPSTAATIQYVLTSL